MNRLFLSIKY